MLIQKLNVNEPLDPSRWDRYVIPKPQYGITKIPKESRSYVPRSGSHATLRQISAPKIFIFV